MWEVESTQLDSETIRYRLKNRQQLMSYAEWIEAIQQADFADFHINVLLQSNFAGYFWEVKPVLKSQVDEPFEFVVVNCNLFTRISASSAAFAEHFTEGAPVVSFSNLGGDAQLIVPAPKPDLQYGHLGAFTQSAPREQQQLFWARVGQEFERKIGNEPKWLSTAGLGVPWLHVRVDSRPKYYSHRPYTLI